MLPRSLPILLVEDNEGYSYLTRRLLESINPAFDVCVAADGEEALRCVRERLPRLVLLDLELPTLPGLDLLRILKSDQSTTFVPVIVLTGHGDNQRVWTAYHQYANALLVKPDSPEELQAALAALNAFWCHHVLLPFDKRDTREVT